MTEIRTGRDALRAALRSRKLGLATIAREIGVAADTLHSFAHGGGSLPAHQLNLIANEVLGGHVIFDEASDTLRPANKTAPISLGVRPPQYDPSAYPPTPTNPGGYAPYSAKGAKPPPKQPKPGWE